ncbi:MULTISPECIES: transporter substrate-binding domain-containing protein [Alteromonadaceae]|uniref:transporter substrate-binding domain-containing protein n=1 Tax=Alteromonadaceae TaxID=72275 RepID=UPI001C086EDE|nr:MULTISPECIES: transporter substrate-binding domain-containing protein [Aliiglaciecola]MBU2877733.1 transporter substrate-binding domain-containing protein [Aliiglaciecola lipolytica]MDO6713314.1 transporter substrate-binding domain-containing protein [Aliiglaciecola sp. 2_MG-2023]MDO6754461.1 transporter substrate-binding domain-containing protein [Aliiglaciecola sp. 1_MG-2023]
MKQIIGMLILSVFCHVATAATWEITYPRPMSDDDRRQDYPVKLLALALDQTGVNYNLQAANVVMLQEKSLKQLAENRSVNVVWSMTDTDRESRLLPIRIPIYKGLIGWRVFLVKKNRLTKFKNIDTMQSLLKFKPIQGFDWPDTKILQSNGFDVITSKNYSNLFTMLANNQGDFVPRSLIEVWKEYDANFMDESIVVEPTLGIKYPAAMYFFVNKSNRTLAKLLENGLEKAIANGQFDKLFLAEFKDIFERSNMDKRFFFQIDNPLIAPEMPIDRKELWY